MGRDPVTVTPPITKSQFKLGLDCILKLRHSRPWPAGRRGKRYRSVSEDNDMLRLLAEGGGAVEALWKCCEPGLEVPKFALAVDGPDTTTQAPEDVSREMIAVAVAQAKSQGTRVSLYEMTIVHEGFSARIDLLRVYPDRLEVLEMKAKSVSADDVFHEDNEIVGKKKGVVARAEWVPYLQDLAFQKVLLEMWVAAHHAQIGFAAPVPVLPGLIAVNKSAAATERDTLGNFHTKYRESSRGLLQPEVRYKGSGAADSALLVEMKRVPEIIAQIEANAHANDPWFDGMSIPECMATMRRSVVTDTWPDPGARKGVRCKKCEYRTKGDEHSGFAECWGKDAMGTRHHVLTLSRVTDEQVQQAIQNAKGLQPLVLDVPPSALEPKKGNTDGAHSLMRKLQYRCLAAAPPNGKLVIKPAFVKPEDRARRMRRGSGTDPCYFLDFECGIYPIPQRAGGRPYEYVPFQFEGHVLPNFDAPLESRRKLDGFLDLTSDDPRIGFLRALREQLGDHGVIYHWHNYEATVLKKLRDSLEAGGPACAESDRDELIAFIDSLVGKGKKGTGRFCDLLEIATDAFYHPDQQGSYSIKKVLPIVWRVPDIREKFQKGGQAAAGDPHCYGSADDALGTRDPYECLGGFPPDFYEALGGSRFASDLEELLEQGDENLPGKLKDGGMAMLYYHYVRLIRQGDRTDRQKPFRDYCGLDSAAMVMVFRYMLQEVPGFVQS
jgi:hypothetical protein